MSQVALREGRRAATLALTALSLVAFLCVALPLPLPGGGGCLGRQLLLLPPTRVPSFWEAVWRCAMTDTLARNATIVAKIAALLTGRQTAGPGFRRQVRSPPAVAKSVRIITVGFGTRRQRMVVERGTNPKRSRRTCSPRYRVPSC